MARGASAPHEDDIILRERSSSSPHLRLLERAFTGPVERPVRELRHGVEVFRWLESAGEEHHPTQDEIRLQYTARTRTARKSPSKVNGNTIMIHDHHGNKATASEPSIHLFRPTVVL